MPIKKRIVIIILCVLVILSVFISGCVLASETSEHPYSSLTPFIISEIDYGVIIYVDSVTGVNYMIFSGYRKSGICPRYNVDGTLYVS